MKVIFTRKIQTQDVVDGVRVGGKSDSAIPTYIDTIKYDNVTSIIETTAGGIDVYEVTYPDPDDDTQEVTKRYGINTYNMMCTGV